MAGEELRSGSSAALIDSAEIMSSSSIGTMEWRSWAKAQLLIAQMANKLINIKPLEENKRSGVERFNRLIINKLDNIANEIKSGNRENAKNFLLLLHLNLIILRIVVRALRLINWKFMGVLMADEQEEEHQ